MSVDHPCNRLRGTDNSADQAGRYCGLGAFDVGSRETSCCFPCPVQDWVYPPGAKSNQQKQIQSLTPSIRLERTPSHSKLPLDLQHSPMFIPPPLLPRPTTRTIAPTLPQHRSAHPRPPHSPLVRDTGIDKPAVLLRCHYAL
jgi:hypothetical protein